MAPVEIFKGDKLQETINEGEIRKVDMGLNNSIAISCETDHIKVGNMVIKDGTPGAKIWQKRRGPIVGWREIVWVRPK